MNEPEHEDDENEDFESKFNRWSELGAGFAGIATTLYQCFTAMCSQGFTAEQALQLTMKFMEIQFKMFMDQNPGENT